MEWWQAVILGLVEGVTEYLPVSSTGHLILVSSLMGLDEDPQKSAVNTYNIIIQVGAIAAVLGLYRHRILQMLRALWVYCVPRSSGAADRDGLRLAVNLVIAFLPAAFLGTLFDDAIDRYLFHPWPVVAALFAGAWLMLAVSYSRRLSRTEHRGRDLDNITWQIALLIGFGQCIAMWPGTSRSMMTIVAALMLGLRPRAAAEFSFLLGLITLSAATGYKAVFAGSEMLEQLEWSNLIVGLLVATVSAAVAVRWFVAFLVRHGVAPFAWYRLALAMVLAVMLVAGWM